MLNIDSNILRHSLEKIMPVVPSRTPVEILENILLQTTDNDLSITGADLTCFASTRLRNIDVKKNINCCIPGKMLFELIKNLDTKLSIEISTDNKILITTDKGKYKLSYLDPSDYPQLPELNNSFNVRIDAEKLKEAFDFVEDSISKEEIRPAMTGVLFSIKATELNIVSTDGMKLAMCKINEVEGDGDFVIPDSGVRLLKKAAAGGGIFDFSFCKTHVKASIGDDVYFIRLIGEKFPDYSSVIPKDNAITAVIDRTKIIPAIKRLLIMSGTEKRTAMSFTTGQVKLSIENADTGNDAKEFYGVEYSGDPFTIAFNGQFLLIMLDNFTADKVQIKMKSPSSAAIVVEEKTDNLALIMPVRM